MTHPRLAHARRVVLAEPGGYEVVASVADGLGLRLKGLTRIPPEAIEPLLFPRCRSLHTFWMKSPIDIVWLDLDLAAGTARVLAVVPRLSPRRSASAPALNRATRKRVGALELGCGAAHRAGITAGDEFALRSLSAAAAPPG